MDKAKSSKRKVKPCPVPSDLCNDVCMYGTPCIRPRLWRTAYEQGKKDEREKILTKVQQAVMEYTDTEHKKSIDCDYLLEWLEKRKRS